MTHAIVLVAGRGSRLRDLTDNLPKPLIQLSGRTLLHRSLESLSEVGITGVTIVTGYRHDAINTALIADHWIDISFAYNAQWNDTGIAASFMTAHPESFNDDVILVYGDIVFEATVVGSCLNDEGRPVMHGVGIPINTAWESLWRARMDDIFTDAESLVLDNLGNVVEIGQSVESLDNVQGQFMGILTLRRDTVKDLVTFYNDQLEGACSQSRSPQLWDITRLLTAWIEAGNVVGTVSVHGGWLEVDTVKDLQVYEKLATDDALDAFCRLR